MTLFGKSVFADVIRDLEMKRSSSIFWVGSESNDKCPNNRHMGYLTEEKIQTHRGEGDVKMEAEIGAMWLATNEANRSWERQETAPLETLEEVCSDTVILDFWLPDL